MGLVYTSLKSFWRTVVPTSFNSYFFDGRSRLSRAINIAKIKLESTASHDELYDAEYYRRQESEMAVSSKAIAASAIEHFSPSSVLDVGCGSGAVLTAFRDLGIPGIGLEYSEAALRICQKKGVDVHKFDIENEAADPIQPADLVLSTEVAEHLPENRADRYVDLLIRLSLRYIVITAATPGQGGTDHVNEQPHSYWIEKFKSRGASYLDSMTNRLRDDWGNRRVDLHRATNVLVFEVMGRSQS